MIAAIDEAVVIVLAVVVAWLACELLIGAYRRARARWTQQQWRIGRE